MLDQLNFSLSLVYETQNFGFKIFLGHWIRYAIFQSQEEPQIIQNKALSLRVMLWDDFVLEEIVVVSIFIVRIDVRVLVLDGWLALPFPYFLLPQKWIISVEYLLSPYKHLIIIRIHFFVLWADDRRISCLLADVSLEKGEVHPLDVLSRMGQIWVCFPEASVFSF